MKILFEISGLNEIGKIVHKVRENIERNNDIICCEIWDDSRKKLSSEDIREINPDLFVNFDLAGFEQNTLMGNVSFNLLECKQIHILTNRELPNEKYLEKQLSISMFFYCTHLVQYRYLLKKYSDMPYLKQMDGWRDRYDEKSIEENANVLLAVIDEVMNICHMN